MIRRNFLERLFGATVVATTLPKTVAPWPNEKQYPELERHSVVTYYKDGAGRNYALGVRLSPEGDKDYDDKMIGLLGRVVNETVTRRHSETNTGAGRIGVCVDRSRKDG